MKGKRFLSVILVIVMIIEIISQMFFKEVLAVENTNNEMNSETTEETAEEQASEEQTSEEIGREYEIKEEETWDISENGDGSVIAKWTLNDKTLRISGNGKMKDWINYEKEDWHNSKYTNIIENVVIEDGVTNIGDWAFSECSNLIDIKISERVTEIGRDAFWECSSLTSINIPNGVTTIKSETFYNCSSLESIRIPEEVTEIGDYTFYGCSSLISIVIPQNVNLIDYRAFTKCNSLENINVDTNNRNYMSENGILFNKEKTELIKFPAAKKDITDYEILEGVTSIGYEAFSGCSNLKSINIPNSVVNIGNYAFENCNKLENINIPENVTKIEDGTFYGCRSLTSIKIPKSITSIGRMGFSECSNLINIEIPEGVMSIEYALFSGCTNLQKVILPTNLTSIENEAFKKCKSLKEIDIPQGVTKLGDNAFDECNNLIKMEFPEYIKQMGFVSYENKIAVVVADSDAHKYMEDERLVYALEGEAKNISTKYELKKEEVWDISENGDKSVVAKWNLGDKTLTISGIGNMKNWNSSASKEDYKEKYTNYINNVIIEEGIKNIGHFAFYGCSNLTNVEIPEGVTNIESSAFKGCSSLTNIKIPEGITEIKNDTFEGCSSLTSIEIPESVMYIQSDVFEGCSNLEKIEVDENNKEYIDENGILFNKEKTEIIRYPARKSQISYEIPEGITRIGWGAFEGCETLISIEIPEEVTDIRSGAFEGCSSLTNIEIPEGVTNIESSAFKGCINLTSIKIPEGVTSIGMYTFEGCSSLTNIEIPEGVTTIGGYAFSNCGKLTNIYIPESVVEIGSCAFSNCSSLVSIKIPNKVTNIRFNTFVGCSNLTNVELSENIENIEIGAFGNCRKLKNIILSRKITDIQDAGDLVPTYNTFEKNTNIYTTSNSIAHKYAENKQQGYILDDKAPSIKILSDKILTNQGQTLNIAVEVQDNFEEVGVKEGTIKYAISDSNTQVPSEEKFTNDVIDGNIEYEMQEGKKYIWVRAEDKLGNVATAVSEEFILDTIAPQVEVTKTPSGKTTQNVIVTIKANEEIQEVEGWTISADKRTLTKEYSENTEETVIVKDIVGNETIAQISVQNIIGEIQKGDINIDDKIDITDVILLKRHLIAENRTNWILTGDNLEAADMNENGRVDISDLLLLKREVAQNV